MGLTPAELSRAKKHGIDPKYYAQEKARLNGRPAEPEMED
jgi:hypothetical protein